MRRRHALPVLTLLLAGTTLGFRCPGRSPTLVEGSGGSTGQAAGGGGSFPGCDEAVAALPILSEPKDALESEEIAFEVGLDPTATSHVLTVASMDGGVVEERPIDAADGIVRWLPTSTGTFRASVTALRDDCPVAVAQTRRFHVCGTMWSTSLLPQPVFDRPAVVADGKVITFAAEGGGVLTAEVEAGGTLGSWSVFSGPVAGELSTRTAAATATAASADVGALVWLFGGNGGDDVPLDDVRRIATQGPQSLAAPPVTFITDSLPLPVGLLDAASAVLDGWMLVVGGFDEAPSPVVYGRPLAANGSLAGNLWLEVEPHPKHPCDFCTAVSFERSLYVLGGDTGESVEPTVARATLEPSMPSLDWFEEPSLPAERADAAAAVDPLYRRIYVAGGGSDLEVATRDVFVADLEDDGSVAAWDVVAPLPSAVVGHSAVWTNGYLHVIGGFSTELEVFSLSLGGPDGTPACPAD